MPTLARFRALIAVLALTAAVAACADGPTSAVPDAPAAGQGKILRPDQAALVRPGDFIVIRPEEYAAYGIKRLRPDGIRAYGAYPCEYTVYGYSCDPCYDEWGNYTPWNYGCYPQEVCYDVNGGQIPCGQDPCYDVYGNYLCGTPTPQPTGPAATYSYASTAAYGGWVNNGGILLKQIQLTSYSQSLTNVASLSVSASFKSVGAADGAGCGNTAGAFDFASASGTGSGAYLSVSRVGQWLGTIKWQVDGTHSFTPISGATGGGTFYTSDSFCG